MHPTARPLDAEFQANSSGSTLPPSDGTDMVIQDFNSFFEKLSGLDDVRWNDDTADHETAEERILAAQAAGRKAPEPKVSEPKAPEAKMAGPKAPEMTAAAPKPSEQKSIDPKAFAARLQAAAANAANAATAPAHLAPATPGTKAAPHRAPMPASAPTAQKKGVPLVAKLAMTALLLFAIGMGAGWLALSLPKTTDRSLLTENPLVPTDGSAKTEAIAKETPAKPAPLANPWGAVKAEAAAAAAAPAPSKVTNKAATVEPAAPLAPKQPELATEPVTATESPLAMKDEPEAFSQKEVEATPKAGAPQAVTVELPKSDLFKNLKPAADSTPKAPRATPPAAASAPVAQAMTQPKAQPAATGTAQYAVQVGACTSAQCVENYRKLIQPHVGSHRVEVMQQASAGAPVQRVRVEPLTKDQAQQLKQSLEQADPRLKNAYVVKLADRS